MHEQQRVKVGDVLGYVGNSGNASACRRTCTSVYRWGREPTDPLPLLLGQRFEAERTALSTPAPAVSRRRA